MERQRREWNFLKWLDFFFSSELFKFLKILQFFFFKKKLFVYIIYRKSFFCKILAFSARINHFTVDVLIDYAFSKYFMGLWWIWGADLTKKHANFKMENFCKQKETFSMQTLCRGQLNVYWKAQNLRKIEDFSMKKAFPSRPTSNTATKSQTRFLNGNL